MCRRSSPVKDSSWISRLLLYTTEHQCPTPEAPPYLLEREALLSRGRTEVERSGLMTYLGDEEAPTTSSDSVMTRQPPLTPSPRRGDSILENIPKRDTNPSSGCQREDSVSPLKPSKPKKSHLLPRETSWLRLRLEDERSGLIPYLGMGWGGDINGSTARSVGQLQRRKLELDHKGDISSAKTSTRTDKQCAVHDSVKHNTTRHGFILDPANQHHAFRNKMGLQTICSNLICIQSMIHLDAI